MVEASGNSRLSNLSGYARTGLPTGPHAPFLYHKSAAIEISVAMVIVILVKE